MEYDRTICPEFVVRPELVAIVRSGEQTAVSGEQ
jgi:hypothetical protein